MTEKEKIKELRNFISQLCCNSNCDNCKWRDVEEGSCLDYFEATALYNAGYRLIPDGAVVLTKEEYEQIKQEYVELKHKVREMYTWEQMEQTRKETAKAIYIAGKYYYAKHSPTERQLSDFLAHIKETYDVEVE